MIEVRLKPAMVSYSRRHNKKLTYQKVADMTGISKATLEALGSRPSYNTTLAVIDTLCEHLECTPSELLAYYEEEN
ncbi:helix-turn-helix domain-containing protein [Vreelandella populi]|uniref:helix-turn-helix domain-containing protein n=1 Tax=Vreelandella populi TaxID=2498858 RepID=UPI000F8E30F9|nr:helix-turn-helix transcriptional regulator [Halomonas populi]RUR52021.1 XRE family transcriptional regulator [Halomonas populi]